MYVLIIVLTFTGHSPGITSSTIQVDRLEKAQCEAMLKSITTNVTGMNSQVRVSGCYPR